MVGLIQSADSPSGRPGAEPACVTFDSVGIVREEVRSRQFASEVIIVHSFLEGLCIL